MRWVLKAVSVVVVGYALAACAGGDDRAAIEDLYETYVSAFERKDAEGIADLYWSGCPGMEEQAASVFEDSEGTDIDVDLDGVLIRSIDDNTAHVRPRGTVRVEGFGTYRLIEADTPLVKEDGDWKIAECVVIL